jgi:D-alanyl-D-alanine carboxypeptidase (penicillin-binding protein 5/6)
MRLPLSCAAAALCLAAAGPAFASPTARDSVGGPLLASHGVVVQPLAGAPPLPTGLSPQSWLVADADTGDVLAAKAPHAPHLPASTLKTLTAVTLLPRLDPSARVTATNADASVDGTKVGLVPRMSYTVDSLFTALLVVSANDAADALAGAAGGMAHTVDLMNAEARHLQAYDTVARTPSGLDAPGEQTSAYDLALIARAGLSMPAFRHYIGIRRSYMPAPHHKRFEIDTHNYLLTTYRGDIGVKNGYTVAAQATYVGAATRHGHTILVTMMHARPDFWSEARSLLNWGFAAEGKVIPVGTLVGPAAPVPATQPVALHDHAAVTLTTRTHEGNGVAAWQVAALAVSAATALSVQSRRSWRRRRGRLSLPPL